jgi:hypothetical protein
MNFIPTNYIFRVGDASHLWSSERFNIWGFNTSTPGAKYFISNVKPGDCLWFVKGASKGLIVAVAIYERAVKRVNGEGFSFEQLGWTNVPGSWDMDIHFNNFKKIDNMNLLSHIKSPLNPRAYDSKCLVNLPEMYLQIYPNEEDEEQEEEEEEEEEEETTVVVTVKRITVEGRRFLKALNGDIYDPETMCLIGTYIDGVLMIEEERDEDDSEKESLSAILEACTKINNEIANLNLLLTNRLSKL